MLIFISYGRGDVTKKRSWVLAAWVRSLISQRCAGSHGQYPLSTLWYQVMMDHRKVSSIECLSTWKPFRHQAAIHPIPTVLPVPRGLCRAAAEAAAHAAVAQSSAGGAVPKAPLFYRRCWSSMTPCATATVCLSCLLLPADACCVTCRQLLPLGKDRRYGEGKEQREQDLPALCEGGTVLKGEA